MIYALVALAFASAGFIAGYFVGWSRGVTSFTERAQRSIATEIKRDLGILAPVPGVDTVCPDCGAHHVRHPAMREQRCDPCVARAFDAEMMVDEADQRDWLSGKDADDSPRLVRLK